MTKTKKPTEKTPRKKALEGKAKIVSGDERQRMIAECAYCIAEQRGFQGGSALDDWLRAEAEVNACLDGKS
ncbi:MAG TPA: DUF2934 domain-containing protein [Mariprofundaceae bacterium]|nr:DUF2934 domain-containing protein [Mariprofundaceae bacterium]